MRQEENIGQEKMETQESRLETQRRPCHFCQAADSHNMKGIHYFKFLKINHKYHQLDSEDLDVSKLSI